MNEPMPIACSLGAGELVRRLDQIAAVGAAGLIAHESEGDRHTLRFRAEPGIRRLLQEILVAEEECCPFLDLALAEEGDELVLTIAAPEDGGPVAHELAAAFVGAG